MVNETEVSFQTSDGWTIHGILSLPNTTENGKNAAVVLIPSPSHDRDVYGHNGYPSVRAAIEENNVATLRIDIRGRGSSSEPLEYHKFTGDQRERVSLDIIAAIEFLGGQRNIDSNRIGILAEGPSAEAAVTSAVLDPRVCALVLLSGRVRPATRNSIVSRKDLPVLCVVSSEDRTGLADMVDVYQHSKHSASDLMIIRDVGIGNPMFFMWAAKYPNEQPLQSKVATWLAGQLQASVEVKEVSFITEDGWKIVGNLSQPFGSETGSPGVVLVHSNLSDRHIFHDLETSLAGAGFAVLNIDFRGRGKSRNKGSYFELSPEERDRAHLDVQGALDFLELQGVAAANRLAIVATSVGVQYALGAACSDPRVKAFVMLGGLPKPAEVAKAAFPFLFVANLGVPQIAEAFMESHQAAKNSSSQLLKYEGGAVGYQLFEMDDKLQPLIVNWLKTQFTSLTN